MHRLTLPLVFLFLASVCQTTPASIITWQPSQDLFQGATVETFVSTNGTLAAAYNATDASLLSTTVNGVNFVGATTGTVLIGPTGESITLNQGGNNQGAFTDGQFFGNIPIFNLLAGGSFNIQDVTLGNLVIGDTYEIQIFSHDGRTSRSNALVGFSDGVNNSVAAVSGELNNVNTGSATSGLTGDFFTGSFTAMSATQTFSVFGDADSTNGVNLQTGISQAAINAIQLRNTTVPEPTSLLVLGMGAIGVAVRRRRK